MVGSAWTEECGPTAAHDLEGCSDSESAAELYGPFTGRSMGTSRLRLRAVMLASTLGMAALVAALPWHGGPQQGDARSSVGFQLMGIIAGINMMGEAASKAAELNKMKEELVDDGNKEYKEKLIREMKEYKTRLYAKLHGAAGNETEENMTTAQVLEELTIYREALIKKFHSLPGSRVMPRENMTDGNACARDEEELGGLCYKNCSLLTNGLYQYRSSAFQCCEDKACAPFNYQVSSPIRMCSGFSIGGDVIGGGCPHPPGRCLHNEEFFHGICYKSCEVLTGGIYPHRSAPFACCKFTSAILCLDPASYKASADMAVGGGAGDGRNWTPAGVHGPLAELTEEPA